MQADAACPRCGGIGFVIAESGGQSLARPCSCRRAGSGRQDIDALLAIARIPRRYALCDFDNFDIYDDRNLSLIEAKSRAARYAAEYPLSDRGLLFMGPPGVGKTHLAVGTLRRLMIDKCVSCLFCDVQDLLRQLQATFDRQSGMTQLELLQPVLQSEVVVLDDLGGRQFSPWLEETLAHIVTTRYNDKKATLVTSNFLDEPRDRGTPRLEDRIGARVRSRLHEMCHLVPVEAADFRMKVKRADHHMIPPSRGRGKEPS